MRHRNKKAILNRPADQRRALLRNLLTSLFLHGFLCTTDAKAKKLVSVAEKLISKIQKKDSMNAIRELKKIIFSKESSIRALEFAQKTEKKSGFCRMTKINFRAGDAAKMVRVELIKNQK